MTDSSADPLAAAAAPRDSRPLLDDEGGEAACWAGLVCPECGRLAAERPPTRCEKCGAALTVD